MLVKFLRRHLSYEPNKVYEVEDTMAQLYVQNGLAAPVKAETVVTMDELADIPAAVAEVLVKNKGGRPRNKPKE